MTGPTPKMFTCVACDNYLFYPSVLPKHKALSHQCAGGIEPGKITVMESSDTPVACPFLPGKGE